MEITGKLIQKMAPQSGVGKTGNNWLKQEFVIETIEQFPKKICANFWGDKADVLQSINIGDTVIMSFSLESREFNGRWYTDIRAWKLEVPTSTPAAGIMQTVSTPAPSTVTQSESFMPEELTSFSDEDGKDDLPF